ncbi:fibronectin type III domain-containing protein [Lacticaseibacillus hulanensis]|uniref:fibronectin type III domain-containing protein n=1 Tax=Lacticaseibacillus hulanensis TaxID=2493111 RepID=UPI000FDBF22C|nr:fibronectin type III domain-containing protein [Lacticaseibacillus hulanensis]
MQYLIYNGTMLLTTVTNVLTYTASGLTPLTSYTFGVSVWNGVRESAKVTLAVKTRGIQLTIPKTLTVGASVTLRRLDYSLGLVPIGTEPAGAFGGTNASTLTATVKSNSGGSSVVELTTADTTFADGTKLTLQPDGTYAAFNGYKAVYYS